MNTSSVMNFCYYFYYLPLISVFNMFIVFVGEPKIRKYQGEPVYLRVTQGNNVTFHCDVTSGTPKPEVTWWFGWTDTTKEVDAQYDSRYSHPTDEKWTITGIETKDVNKYRCRAKNAAGEDYLRFEITGVDSTLFSFIFTV